MGQMLVMVLSYPTLGVVAVMEIVRVAYPALHRMIKFLWERIAVMSNFPAVGIFRIFSKKEMEAIL